MFVLLWNPSSIFISRTKIFDNCPVLQNQLNSNSTLQKRWGNKTKVLSNIYYTNIFKWIIVYTHIYIFIKHIYIKKIPHICQSTDGESRQLIYYSKNVRKTPEERNFNKWACILYIKFHSGTVSNFCLCKSTTRFLRKRNIDFKQSMGWKDKWVTSIGSFNVTWCIVPSKILNFLLTIKISYFLFFRYVKISRSIII